MAAQAADTLIDLDKIEIRFVCFVFCTQNGWLVVDEKENERVCDKHNGNETN